MGEAKRRGTYQERVKQAKKAEDHKTIKFYDANNHIKMNGFMNTFPEGMTQAPDTYVVNAMVYAPSKMMPIWTAMTNQGLVYSTKIRTGMPRGNEQMIEALVGEEFSQDTWMMQISVISDQKLTTKRSTELCNVVINSIPDEYKKHFINVPLLTKNGQSPAPIGIVGLKVA